MVQLAAQSKGAVSVLHYTCCPPSGSELTSVLSTSVLVWFTTRHVPPLSVNVTRKMPLPCWTTSRAPVVSKTIPRGAVKPVAISCAVHPEPTTGASYDGFKMVPHVELTDWASVMPGRAVVTAQNPRSPCMAAIARLLSLVMAQLVISRAGWIGIWPPGEYFKMNEVDTGSAFLSLTVRPFLEAYSLALTQQHR